MYRISDNYKGSGAPIWSWQDVLFVKVGDKTERGIQPGDRFVQQVNDQLKEYEQYLNSSLIPDMPDSVKKPLRAEWEKYKVKMDSLSKGENMLRRRPYSGRWQRNQCSIRLSVEQTSWLADKKQSRIFWVSV